MHFPFVKNPSDAGKLVVMLKYNKVRLGEEIWIKFLLMFIAIPLIL